MENLDGKCVVLGVTGGIAAYKMANVASGLRKAGADVHVIMTENATQFITPLTFETLTNNRCVVDTFARDFKYEVTHISLAKAADLIMIAPATANVIAKMANRKSGNWGHKCGDYGYLEALQRAFGRTGGADCRKNACVRNFI